MPVRCISMNKETASTWDTLREQEVRGPSNMFRVVLGFYLDHHPLDQKPQSEPTKKSTKRKSSAKRRSRSTSRKTAPQKTQTKSPTTPTPPIDPLQEAIEKQKLAPAAKDSQ